MVSSLLPAYTYSIAAALSGAVTGVLALRIYRQYTTDSDADSVTTDYYPDLARPFSLTLAIFSCSAFVYAVTVISIPTEPVFGLGFPSGYLIAIPWLVFALRYAGREYLLTVPRIVALFLITLPLTTLTWTLFLPGFSTAVIPQSLLLLSAVLIFIFGTAIFLTSGLTLLSSYRHSSYSSAGGVFVVLPIAVILVTGQLSIPDQPRFSVLILTAGHVAAAGTFLLSVTRYNVLSNRPGTGTLGERHVVQNMDEAMIVVDQQGNVIQANETAAQLFGDSIEGKPFRNFLNVPATELSQREIIERWTDRGRMQFDPRVSVLTSSRGHTLGHTVTLLDVTEREIRQQRIQVLNRILRHNFRNSLDVIIANAEADLAEKQGGNAHSEVILDTATELTRLGADARRVEQLITNRNAATAAVDVAATVEAVVENSPTVQNSQATSSIDAPSVTVQTNEQLFRFVLKNAVENAVEHNDGSEPAVEIRVRTTEDSVRIHVVDNGPGIPESERAVLETGEESPLQHATSLGLWSIKWGVETMGGSLSFGESDLGGAAVRIELPI